MFLAVFLLLLLLLLLLFFFLQDGISLMRQLIEVHVSFNHIYDLEPLGDISAPITTLDLESNLVWDYGQIDYLFRVF